MTITPEELAQQGETSATLLTGVARVECPICGTPHQSEEFSWGVAGQGSYCPDCAEEHVPEEDRDLVDALNTLDLEVFSAQLTDPDRLRMLKICATVQRATDHIVARYAGVDPDALRAHLRGGR